VLTASDAVRLLIERVRAKTAGEQADDRKSALLLVLDELHVSPAELPAWADGLDVLGEAYERLLTGAERRDDGQFQTPFFAADLMAGWLLREPTGLLLDPGVGAGRLLFRAAGRENPPKRLLGYDTDPVACAMARMNLALRGLSERSEVLQHNFLRAEPTERPDALTCNPPYSRHHALPAEAKAAIHEGFEERLALRLSRLAALHALFLVRALEVVADGGRLAFITPADWLDVGYGRAVKSWVLERAQVEALILFPDGHLPFGADVMSSAAITLLRKHGTAEDAAPPATGATRFLLLPERLPNVERVLAALDGEKIRGLRSFESELSAEVKWGRLPAATKPARRGKPGGRPLSQLARVRRGVATGANEFFVISEARRRELDLPKDELRACIAKPRLVQGLELTSEQMDALPETTPRWLLNCRRPEAETEESQLGTYLREGRELGIHEGYLASRRKPWFAPERRDDCRILFTYFNRAEPRFVRNRADAVPLNNWLIIEPADGVDADALWLALNSEAIRGQLLVARRDYAGMWKLEPKELSAISVRLT
jgi:hypothetical protein